MSDPVSQLKGPRASKRGDKNTPSLGSFQPPVQNSSKYTNKDASNIVTVIATPGCGSTKPLKVKYANQRVIGNGSFGVVYKADFISATNETDEIPQTEPAVEIQPNTTTFPNSPSSSSPSTDKNKNLVAIKKSTSRQTV